MLNKIFLDVENVCRLKIIFLEGENEFLNKVKKLISNNNK